MYQLTYTLELEGDISIFFDTLEEVKEWIRRNERTYEYSWDNLQLKQVNHIDIYGLMEW